MTDVIIIGGGPAGVTAAIYTARAGLETTIIYKNFGALENAERVDNFYGFTKISGKSLVQKGLRQARACGAKTVKNEVVGISQTEGGIIVETAIREYKTRTVVLATGANRSTPKIHGLADLAGRGISYCAICDGFFYRGKDVAVLGNSAYALHEIRDLLPIVSSVTLLTNGEELPENLPEAVIVRAEKIKEMASASSVFNGVIFENGEFLPLSGLFIAEGIAGGTELARRLGAIITPENSIKTDDNKRTNIPGIWAAGDCTGGLKQIAKAAHEGAAAGLSIVNSLRN